MRIELGFFLNFERAPKEPLREIDIPGTATERLPEFEETDIEARRRVGFQAGGR